MEPKLMTKMVIGDTPLKVVCWWENILLVCFWWVLQEFMEQGDAVVQLSFRALLAEICSALGFRRPIYNRSLSVAHECCVIVQHSNGPHSLVIIGGDEGTFRNNAERAARAMCFHLVGEYGLRVEDVSLALWEDVESTCNDFRLKRVQLERVETGMVSLPVDESAPVHSPFPPGPVIPVDFYSVLEKIVAKSNVHLSPIEYLQYDVLDFKAYLSVSNTLDSADKEWIRSDRCSSKTRAKQCLAKKVILYLRLIHRFTVDDINSEPLKRATMTLNLERESYLTIKERVYGIQEDFAPKPALTEEIPLTPRGIESRVGESSVMPLPPKKRPYCSSSRGFSDVVPREFVPDALDGVIPRKKTSFRED